MIRSSSRRCSSTRRKSARRVSRRRPRRRLGAGSALASVGKEVSQVAEHARREGRYASSSSGANGTGVSGGAVSAGGASRWAKPRGRRARRRAGDAGRARRLLQHQHAAVRATTSRIAGSSSGQIVRRSSTSTSASGSQAGGAQREVDAGAVGHDGRVAPGRGRRAARPMRRAMGGSGRWRRAGAGRAPCARRRAPGRRPRRRCAAARRRRRRCRGRRLSARPRRRTSPRGTSAWNGPPRMPPP